MKKRLQLKLGGLSLDGNSGLSIDIGKAQEQMESEFQETPLMTTIKIPQVALQIVKEDVVMNEQPSLYEP